MQELFRVFIACFRLSFGFEVQRPLRAYFATANLVRTFSFVEIFGFFS